MALTLDRWRERAGRELQRLRGVIPEGAPYAVYGAVSALVLWPAIQAASADGASTATVVTALTTILSQAGLNVAVNPLVNWLNDRVRRAPRPEEAQVAAWVTEAVTDPALRADLDLLLARLDALPAAARGLAEADRAWLVAALRAELGQLGNLGRHEQTLNLIIQGDYVAGNKFDLSGHYPGTVNVNPTIYQTTPDKPPYTPPPLPPPGELPPPGPLPPGSRIPYDPNPLFTGREKELLALAELLVTSHSPLVTIHTGIGGIGKTQLAVEFVHRYGRFFAGGAQWVSLADGDPAAVAREVAECGLRLGLWSEDDDAKLSPEEKVRRTRRAWARPEPRLIVFDNCDGSAPGDDGRPGRDARDLLEAWRPEPGGARLLVTSRSGDWPAGFAALAVPPLPRPESIALLREYLEQAKPQRRESDAALDAVAAELGDLPLALTLAGSYLAEYPGVAVAAYLAELRAPNLLDHPSLRGQGRPQAWTKHDLDVARTFRVSLDRLRPDENGADAAARRLLAGAACLVPGEPFPRQLLLGMLDDTDDPHRPDDALRRLLALGLLERVGEGRLRLHRLLAAFVAEELADQMDIARSDSENGLQHVLDIVHESGDPRLLRGAERHLYRIVDVAVEREDETAARLANNLAYILQAMGDLSGARPYYERALAIFERVLGPEHPNTAASLNNLGYLLQAQGDLAGARPYYERALAIWERILGTEHPATAHSLNNLGALLQAQGDLSGARPYYERALAVRERVLGPEHPATAQSLNNLGYLLQAQGDLAGARPYYERDLAGARPYYERALAIFERVLGPEHPATAQSLNNLGALLYAQGDLAGARPYFERALGIRERVLGPEHPDTAQSLNNLGYLLQAQGDLSGARPYYERALAIDEKVLGTQHPDTAMDYNNLGGLLQAQGNLAGARPYYERALAIRERVLGPEHPDTALSLDNLGYLLQAQGDLAGARSYYERALAIRERVLGPEHPDTAQSLWWMGVLAQTDGKREEAGEYYRRAQAIYLKVLGPDHASTRDVTDFLERLG